MGKSIYLVCGYLLVLCIFQPVTAQTSNGTANAETTVANTTAAQATTAPATATEASVIDTTTSDDTTGFISITTIESDTPGSGSDLPTTTTTEETTAINTTPDGSGTSSVTTTTFWSSTASESSTTTSTVATTTSAESTTAPGPGPVPTTSVAPEQTTASSTTTSAPPTKSTTTIKSTTTTTPSSGLAIILPIALIFGIVLIIFLVVLYLYCTGKELPCPGRKGGQEIIQMPQRKPSNAPRFTVGHMIIGREEFEVHHKRKIADDGRGYREEFRAVHTESSAMSAARDAENAPKNRYDNVLPWDSSRVVLSVPTIGNACDDYINANFVPGYLQEKKFIACQGPKENTCGDFWKMMWEQKCATIVMVTNLIEAKKPKCQQYWPGEDTSTGESAKYGDYLVTTVDVKIRNYYVTRTLKLQLLDYPPRMIRQLHYTAWPDFGVPKNPHELLLFRRRVIAANPPHSGPIVVHCSAGVGRTGTFILIDAAMEQLLAEGKVDLFSFLTKMRKYRMMLVQTEAQYTFAHSAILEFINYGDTEVSVKKFRAQVHSLREYDEGSDETILDEQFSSLLKVQMNKDNMKHGRQSIKKNRVLQIIPYDDNRVTLPLKPGQERTDYINASFIDGFKEKNAYIATQGPLAETAADFWTMIWVYQSQNIVMLTALVEKGHEMCTQYWPQELNGEVTYGDITVKYVSKDDDDVVDYVVREFVITNSALPDESERKVRQFHYTGWPEVGPPSDAHGMIEIANRLTSKDKNGNPRPSVVHCSSGGGRTGVFVALNILMEQADSDGLVDVFQTVKSLRAQRPHIIQAQEQLYFCYVALLQYLETNQLAGDNTTLSSNINSSIGNQSESVAASTGGAPSSFLRVENTTPQGSMNNKLDMNSVNDQESIVSESKTNLPPPPSEEIADEQTPSVPEEVQSPTTLSTDSVSQALLKPDDDNGNSSSSHSDFEIVNENGQDVGISV